MKCDSSEVSDCAPQSVSRDSHESTEFRCGRHSSYAREPRFRFMISSHLRHGAENGYLMASKSMLDRELLSLRGLTEYASVSERTLREWLHRSTDALPAVRFDGKILVS